MKRKLIQLTNSNVNELMGKNIVCVQWLPEYLEEIASEFPKLPEVNGVVVSKTKYGKNREYRGRIIKTYDIKALQELPDNTVLLITTAYYENEYAKLCSVEIPDHVYDTVFYYVNKDTRYYKYYLDKYKEDDTDNIIVFRSGPPNKQYVYGLDYGDNARALFEYMVNAGFQKKYQLIWFVNNPSDYQDLCDKNGRILFFPYSASVTEDEELREQYYYYLCHAKFIFFTEAHAFCRYQRDGQIRVQLWHGCGYKGSTVVPTMKPTYEYMPVISKLYAELHARYFGLEPEQMLVTGYPKEDWLFHPNPKWREMLSIPTRKKTIFWMPTFRTTVEQRPGLSEPAIENETGISLIDKIDQAIELNDILSKREVQLVIKLHPLQERAKIKLPELSNISMLYHDSLVDNGLEINQTLGDADALISDYSSAATDYLVLNRPMAFAMEDEGAFLQRRGFLFDNLHDWLPGAILSSFEELAAFVQAIGEGEDSSRDKRDKIRYKLNEFEDDRGSERLLNRLGITNE